MLHDVLREEFEHVTFLEYEIVQALWHHIGQAMTEVGCDHLEYNLFAVEVLKGESASVSSPSKIVERHAQPIGQVCEVRCAVRFGTVSCTDTIEIVWQIYHG